MVEEEKSSNSKEKEDENCEEEHHGSKGDNSCITHVFVFSCKSGGGMKVVSLIFFEVNRKNYNGD